MELLLSHMLVFCGSLSLISAAKSTPPVLTQQTETNGTIISNTSVTEAPASRLSITSAQHTGSTSISGGVDITSPATISGDDPGNSDSPITKQVSNRISSEDVTQATFTTSESNSLTMLAFGVMSFILVLIVVMIILVTAVNLKERCHNTKEEGVKGSVLLESNPPITGENESITLVSVRSLNTDDDTDSPQISSIHSTILDSEDQDLSRELLCVNTGQ